MSLHNAQIKLILKYAKAIAVGIDNRNVVVFTHQVFRQRAAHLTGTQNDYLHGYASPIQGRLRGPITF
ncbi:hypothetical protein BN136_2213 [Cronobacter universalis NCTC 9529]|nr:hypothetical protein BN136_2213 [Cronobacter universalis NCTC 9529]